MAEAGGTEIVPKYLGTKDFLTAPTRVPLALVKFFRDGTLVFAAEDNQRGQSLDLGEGLAAPYQRHFANSPELVAAIERAFRGEAASATVRIDGGHWDARLFPTFSAGALGGVVGILTDASDRITAFRVVSAIELLSQIRHYLARSDSTEEFIEHCCGVIEELYPGVWIGIADRQEPKPLRVIAGKGESSTQFAGLSLSWDIGRKNGRQPAGEAVRSGRVQVTRDLTSVSDPEAWGNRALPWQGLLAVPLVANGASLGVLVIHSDDDNTFDAEMIRLWEKIANEVTEGIELLRAREERTRILTERQGAHQQYQELLDTIFDVVVLHRHGKIVKVNPAAVKLAGFATADEMIGMPVLALIDPGDRDRMKDTLAQSSSVHELMEFRLLRLDGGTIEVEGLTVSSWHEGTQARLSHWRDISERKRSEQLLVTQKTRLEYAQQVGKSGSIELEVTSGLAEWSKNALTILGLGPDMQRRRFVEAVASVLIERDRDAVVQLVDQICKTAKEQSCEVSIRTEDAARTRTIHLHGIPQLEKHVFVPRIFIVVQDISVFRNAEQHLRAKLTATRELARIAEWTYELDQQMICFVGSMKAFLGVESPVKSITYDQYLFSIREEDREAVRRAVEHTLRYGSDGEVMYEEQFHEGLKLFLFTRWVPERNAEGKIVRFRGLSVDITRARQKLDREARKERIQSQSGLPEKEIAYDRLYYLATRATRFGLSFSAIGIQIRDYRDIKRHMANDQLYYQTQSDIARGMLDGISEVDTFARLGRGRFLLILSRPATRSDVDQAQRVVLDRWLHSLKHSGSPVESITVDTAVVHCPQDGAEWEGLLLMLEQKLDAQ